MIKRIHALCPWGKSSSVSLMWAGETCYMSSSNRGRVMNRKTIHVSWPDTCYLERSSLPNCSGPAKIFLYQIIFYLYYYKKSKDVESRRKAMAGDQATAFVKEDMGWKQRILQKSPGPFLLSFDCYYHIHDWPFSCFMEEASWNSWNLLCFHRSYDDFRNTVW